MALIEWRKEFETGIASLDHEHRELVGLLNELDATLIGAGARDSIIAFLGEVLARIAAHFALEEAVMRERRYEGLPEHKADHERLLDDIRDIMDGYEAEPVGDAAFRADFGRRLQAWFMTHFREQDARLHRLLEE